MQDQFLTIKEAATVLGVHWQSIRNYIKDGQLAAVKIGRTVRINKADLEKFSTQNISTPSEREVELRFILKNQLEVEDRLRKLGAKIIDHTHVVDYLYVPRTVQNLTDNDKWHDSESGYALRIRKVEQGYSERTTTTFEVKKPNVAGSHTDMVESEVLIDNYDTMHRSLILMGYKQFCVIDKQRLVYKLGDLKYVFDDIAGWGVGLEIEMVTAGDYDRAYAEIMQQAGKLGLSEADFPQKSLTRMAMETLAKF